MLCLSGFELYSHWVPLLCIRGGRGKSGRKGRRQEKLSNNAINILQSKKGLWEKTKKKGAGARNKCKVWEGRGLYPVSPPIEIPLNKIIGY